MPARRFPTGAGLLLLSQAAEIKPERVRWREESRQATVRRHERHRRISAPCLGLPIEGVVEVLEMNEQICLDELRLLHQARRKRMPEQLVDPAGHR